MKRKITILLLALLCLSFTGCSKGSTTKEEVISETLAYTP